MLTDTLLKRAQIGKEFVMERAHAVMRGIKAPCTARADQNGRAEEDAVEFDDC